MLTATRQCDYQTNYFVSGVLTTISFFILFLFTHVSERLFQSSAIFRLQILGLFFSGELES